MSTFYSSDSLEYIRFIERVQTAFFPKGLYLMSDLPSKCQGGIEEG